MDGGAWWAAVHGVAKSQTRLSNFTFTFHFSLSCIGEGNGNPLQYSCLENPRDGGAWRAAVYEVTQSRTWLKWLSSSSSSSSSSIWEPNTSFWKIYLSQFNRKVKNNSFKSVRTQGRIIYYIIFPWTFFSVILKCFRKLKWKTGI